MIDIDPMYLEPYLKQGAEFWCATDKERVALLTTLDELGYQWYSGNKLLAMTRADYQVEYAGWTGISYCIMDYDDKRITKGRALKDNMILVSDLIESAAVNDIDQSALLTMIFETEVTA